MSRRQHVWPALVAGLVLFFGQEYRDEARRFLRHLIRVS